jgi:Fuc2NAc and GlcNAc transferase
LIAGTALMALAGAGVLVALVGWVDDRQSVAARWRLAVHFLAAGWGLFWLGGLPPVVIYAVEFDLGWLGHGLALLYLVWLLNLYNFMDGIDGLAGVEAVTVAAGGTVLLALAGFGLDS